MLMLVPLIWNCKQNPDTPKPKVEESIQETVAVAELPTIIMELAKFAESRFSDATNIDVLINFKTIDANGTVSSIDKEKAVDLYKAMTKPAQTSAMPIFEVQNTDTSILPIQGKGFGGAIWANVLVDNKTLEIKKVAFEHKAESDDYGAAMTQTSFEDQFVGTKINLESKTFSLQKAVEKAVDDGLNIDGISGATMTSQGVVDMMNEGLRKYRNYLVGE